VAKKDELQNSKTTEKPAKVEKTAKKDDAPKKEEKSLTRQQPNIFQRAWAAIRRYFNETIGELRKVTWPTRKEATNLTIVVVAVTFAMGALLGVLDYIFSAFFAWVFSL
jgi:preprotein translocase subunit SecE